MLTQYADRRMVFRRFLVVLIVTRSLLQPHRTVPDFVVVGMAHFFKGISPCPCRVLTHKAPTTLKRTHLVQLLHGLLCIRTFGTRIETTLTWSRHNFSPSLYALFNTLRPHGP